MRFVLLGVKKCVEIISDREIALRRTDAQSALFCHVTDCAGLLRFGSELLDMTFDASFVAGKLQPLLFVALGSLNQILHQIPLVVAGITFQFMRLKRPWHFDDAKMRLMREAFVVRRRLRGCHIRRRGRRRWFRLLAACNQRR